MKWYKFSQKMPEIGSNILVMTDSKKIGIYEFCLVSRKRMIDELNHKCVMYDEILIDYHDDDPDLSYFDNDIILSKYWAYPSSAKIPKD